MVADARLFGTSGGELLSRSLDRDPHLAVSCSARRPDVDDAVHYLQYGAMDYLRKPFDLSHVEAAVQKVPARRQAELMRERGSGPAAQG